MEFGPEPAVVLAMRRYKDALLRRERLQLAELARLWYSLSSGLEAEALEVARQIELKRAGGWEPSRWQIQREARLIALLEQIRRRVKEFDEKAERSVASGQRAMAETAIEDASGLIREAAEVAVSFDRLPVEAVEAMFGNSASGAPLGELFALNYPETATAFTEELVRSVALGLAPVATARRAARKLEIPLQRAIVTARTEQLRVYREATRRQYAASGVVRGQMRLATKDKRTCPACLMADGEVLGADEVLAEHPQGRCTTIPILKGKAAPQWETGREWFEKQDAATQAEILGKGRYGLWKSGDLDLRSIPQRTVDPVWGPSLRMRAMGDEAVVDFMAQAGGSVGEGWEQWAEGAGLSEKELLDKAQGTGREVVCAYDAADRQIMVPRIGGFSRAPLPDPRELDLTGHRVVHTHTLVRSLSRPDLRIAVERGVGSVAVRLPDGRTASLEFAGYYGDDLEGDVMAADEEAWNLATDEVDRAIDEEQRRGMGPVPLDERIDRYNELVFSELHGIAFNKVSGLVYRVERNGAVD